MAIRGSALVTERDLFREYPFLPGAESLVRELSPSLGDLVRDPAFARARELGRARVRAAVDDPTGATEVEELAHAESDERFLSFLYARLLLSTPSALAPVRRWAVAEAKGASARLNHASAATLIEVAERLGYPVRLAKGEVWFSVPDYLRLATPVREAEFRLVRQAVKDGQVRVDPKRATRLLQEGIRLELSHPVDLDDDARRAIDEREHEFLAEVVARIPAPTARAALGFGPVAPEKFPPCIRKMERMLQGGENLSHAGRFALAAFLHRVGADFETIVDAYRGAPDFDEGVTRYQVEHITHRDGGRGYEPPECATLRSHGLCFREGDPSATRPADKERDARCFEPDLRHPLQYYRIAGGRVPEPPREDAPPTSGGAAPAPAGRGAPR